MELNKSYTALVLSITMKTFIQQLLPASLAVAMIGAVSSCTPAQQQAAQYGALGGAALGALNGDDISGIARKAGIGAAIGAVVVAAQDGSLGQFGSQSPAAATTQYPYGTATGSAGYIKSPYSPYNVIDVRGVASGSQVREPGSNNVFLVP